MVYDDTLTIAIKALQAFADKASWSFGQYDETGPHTEFTFCDQDSLAARAISLIKDTMTDEQIARFFK